MHKIAIIAKKSAHKHNEIFVAHACNGMLRVKITLIPSMFL
jgi:hypothetical protein